MGRFPKYARGLDGSRVELDEYGIPPSGTPVFFDPLPRISRTPASTLDLDPDDIDARDPRDIRSLTPDERPEPGCWLGVAAFENWRGKDGWFYVDVLSVDKDMSVVERVAMPVGPLSVSDLGSLRMAGDQLVMRMLDPHGRVPIRS